VTAAPKRVLVIAYYWPPSGGGGVQRWLKFVKYLPEHGWEPVVYVPDDPYYPEHDGSLARDLRPDLEVIRRPILEPYVLFEALAGTRPRARADSVLKQPRTDQNAAERLSVWVRSNFFIPDARMLWIAPSVRFLLRYLRRRPVDAIVSTGPPHSLHLIARALARRQRLPWLADFRDPWTRIEYHADLPLTPPAAALHRRLERNVLRDADVVVAVSWQWEREMQALGAAHTHVITNGYDEDDFAAKAPALRGDFRLAHVGTFDRDRDHQSLWRALAGLREARPDFARDLTIELVGRIDAAVFDSLDRHGLRSQVEHEPWLPHDEAIRRMRAAQVLLLLINRVAHNAAGRVAGKLFEYLAAERPVLCIGPPEGDSARLVARAAAGACADFDDEQRIRELLSVWYDRYRAGTLGLDGAQRAQFSRRALTERLASVLDDLTSENPG